MLTMNIEKYILKTILLTLRVKLFNPLLLIKMSTLICLVDVAIQHRLLYY